MRVLLLFDNLEVSGITSVARGLMSTALACPNLSIKALVCMTDKLGSSLNNKHIHWPTSWLGCQESLPIKLLKLSYLLIILPFVASRYDLILSSCPPTAAIGWWASLWSRTPLITWVHYDSAGRKRESIGSTTSVLLDFLQNLLYYRLVPSLRRLVFVGHRARDSMITHAGLPSIPKQWTVIPNICLPISVSELSSTPSWLDSILSRQEPLILFVGRLARQKRWEHCLQAAESLTKMGVNAQWLFIGDGPEADLFKHECNRSPVKERLHASGFINDPLPIMAKADALVVTSLYEAWPTIILEAFSLLVPVVSYNCPSGPSDLLGNNERGWLIPEHPNAAAKALAEILDTSNADEVARRCEGGREFLRFHSPSNILPQWIELFHSVLSE